MPAEVGFFSAAEWGEDGDDGEKKKDRNKKDRKEGGRKRESITNRWLVRSLGTLCALLCGRLVNDTCPATSPKDTGLHDRRRSLLGTSISPSCGWLCRWSNPLFFLTFFSLSYRCRASGDVKKIDLVLIFLTEKFAQKIRIQRCTCSWFAARGECGRSSANTLNLRVKTIPRSNLIRYIKTPTASVFPSRRYSKEKYRFFEFTASLVVP